MKENKEIKSTAHSRYRCQYHIVFAPKYRRQEIYGKLKKDIGEILRKLCEQKGAEIIGKTHDSDCCYTTIDKPQENAKWENAFLPKNKNTSPVICLLSCVAYFPCRISQKRSRSLPAYEIVIVFFILIRIEPISRILFQDAFVILII